MQFKGVLKHEKENHIKQFETVRGIKPCFQGRSYKHQRCLVARLVCLSVRLFACISAIPTGLILMKTGTGDCYENLWRNPKLGKIGEKCLRSLREDLRTIILLTTVRNTLQLENKAKGTLSCFSIATLSGSYCWQLLVS